MQTCTIGYEREDGDFAILATLNNIDGLIDDATFASIVDDVTNMVAAVVRNEGVEVTTLERQDTPDYINLVVYDSDDFETGETYV
jgi:hypothetical protein